jgi:hypothetical protein
MRADHSTGAIATLLATLFAAALITLSSTAPVQSTAAGAECPDSGGLNPENFAQNGLPNSQWSYGSPRCVVVEVERDCVLVSVAIKSWPALNPQGKQSPETTPFNAVGAVEEVVIGPIPSCSSSSSSSAPPSSSPPSSVPSSSPPSSVPSSSPPSSSPSSPPSGPSPGPCTPGNPNPAACLPRV